MPSRSLAWSLALSAVLAACGGGGTAGPPAATGGSPSGGTPGTGTGGSGGSPNAGSVARSSLARETAPTVSDEDAAALGAGNQQFAADLYRAVRSQAGNMVFSPESISLALGMTYAGAGGQTAAQMATTLHFTLPPERLHRAFNTLDLTLTGRGQGQPAGAFQLSLANAVWAHQGFMLLPGFLDTLARDYGAGVRRLDFGMAEPARLTINAWVSDETRGKIPELLGEGAIKPNTRLVLTNAVYFKADWASPFGGQSRNGTFHALGGDVSVPMMVGPENIPLWGGKGYQAASLPYVGNSVSMVVVVPDAGTFEAFEGALTGDVLRGVLETDAASRNAGTFSMPRFKFEQRLPLAMTLQSMGMTDAFAAGAADLSGMTGQRDLYIQDVIHQATIAVDEKGTEAAAATAVIIGKTSVPANRLVVDRPFLFFIRDNPTGSILFMGRVVDPSR